MSAIQERRLAEERQKADDALTEAYYLGYAKAHNASLEAAHDAVIGEIRKPLSCLLGRRAAATRVYEAVRVALSKGAP